MARIFDRVKQLCDAAFTGTGSILIDGADAAINGFARFSDAVPGGTDIYYVVESTDTDKNEWEVGVGQYAAGAISRLASRVIAGSAGAGALVNFTAGEKVVYIAALSRTLDGQVKNDLLTDFVPDATNDETEGFERGSIVFGGGTFWICSDPAENTAVWSMLSGPLAEEALSGYSIIYPGSSNASAIFDLTQTGPQLPGVSGITYDAGVDSFNEFTSRTAWRAQTNDNTPTNISAKDEADNEYVFALPDAGVGSIEAMVHASADGAYKVWKVTVGFERHFDTSDYVINFGTMTKTVVFDSGTTTGWDVNAVSPSTFEVGLAVTGDNVAPAINWYADVALTFVPVPAL